jgi:hypothetical protein
VGQVRLRDPVVSVARTWASKVPSQVEGSIAPPALMVEELA